MTEVVQLGSESIIITRLLELQPTPTPTALPPAKPNLPVELDLTYAEILPNLDPQFATGDAGLDLAENLFIGLTNFDPLTRRLVPELATDWTLDPSGRIWTFNLRDDIYWVEPYTGTTVPGTPPPIEVVREVDAHDVVFAMRRVCTRQTGIPDAFLYFVIAGCEQVYGLAEPDEQDLTTIGVVAEDDHTVQVTLTEPASHFLSLTALPQSYPVPRELVEEHGNNWRLSNEDLADGWQTPANIVVSGPYVPRAEGLTDEALVLDKNPHWPLTSPGNIEVVNITLGQAIDDSYAAWSAKDLDVSPLPIEEREAFLSRSPARAKLISDETLFYIGFAFDSPVFKEVEVRRAFSAAIDRELLVEQMFEGRALPQRHLTPSGLFGAPPPGEVGVGYSPDFARLQMDSSTFRNCRLIPPVTFLVSTADLSLLQAELIRDMWIDELDCDETVIIIEQVEFGALMARTSPDAGEERPDMWELAWPPYYPDAHNVLYNLLHCEEGENRQARPCSEVDRLLRQADLTPQLEEREALYRQVENLLFGENGIFPAIPLYVRGDYRLVQNWLTYEPALLGGEQFDTYQIDEELKNLERSRN